MWHLWEQKRCIKGFGWGPEGKRPFGIPRRKWEDNIKMDLQEVNEGMDMIDLAQYRGQVAGSSECGNEPSCSIKCWEFLEYLKNC